MRRLLVIVVLAGGVGTGGALVAAAAEQLGPTPNAAHHQYREKPGCGPDSTDGVAGNSGRHTGQPPKQPDRQDCPEPPGQQP